MLAGNISIRIKGIFYEIPNVFLFKSPKNEDCYLSGITTTGNGYSKKITGNVRHIVSGIYQDVDFNSLEKYLEDKYKKLLFYNEEYDIPLIILESVLEEYNSIQKYDIKSKNNFIQKHIQYKSIQ